MVKAMILSYVVGNNLYLNLTNQCPCSCIFCIRNHSDGAYGSNSLWLEHEPSVDEILDDLTKRDINLYEEIVFCGYGEPTCRIEVLLAVAKNLKNSVNCPKLRINTNGLGDLINEHSIVGDLCEVFDIISVSLNAGTKEEYIKVTRPKYENAWEAMQKFTKDCVKLKKAKVIMSVVDVISQDQIDTSYKVAEKLGAQLRVRTFDK